jgi:hypothetical protein
VDEIRNHVLRQVDRKMAVSKDTQTSGPTSERFAPSATSALIPSALIPSALIPSALIPSALIPSALIPSALIPSARSSMALIPAFKYRESTEI